MFINCHSWAHCFVGLGVRAVGVYPSHIENTHSERVKITKANEMLRRIAVILFLGSAAILDVHLLLLLSMSLDSNDGSKIA